MADWPGHGPKRKPYISASTLSRIDLQGFRLAGAVKKAPHEEVCAGNIGRVVALLHNKGKTNQQITNGWRLPTEEDAAIAVLALGFTFRELGWARDTSFIANTQRRARKQTLTEDGSWSSPGAPSFQFATTLRSLAYWNECPLSGVQFKFL